MQRNLSIWGKRGTRALLGAALLLMPASCIPMASAVGGQLGKAIVRAARQDEPAEVTEPTEPQRVERANLPHGLRLLWVAVRQDAVKPVVDGLSRLHAHVAFSIAERTQ